MEILKRIKQCFCKHKYKKHFNHKQSSYERRCVKCGKVE